ncbi:hypothetical protein POSPLADRAFT_1048084 [Postia placenta MAD-698-R-SB12]|uniref:BRCT domain-containing protein n=1 Tax=Postia placenta MAD-698-R-SB12 TaxID=670580 RepID=A0A1X6MWG9_9APHY|nr:hypothetical protein POSPLADRAFT_1048084 [Postia placenta MAD-698-R-SB12]OSX60707.1 hypothetical protein POSPLADRAFT_1048084 [Postia placenta MAD-698-R-SB12]
MAGMKPKAPPKVQGKDIRGFFNGGSGHTTPSGSQRSHFFTKSQRVMEEDDEPAPRPALERKKAVLLSSDDEDEDVKVSPPKKKPATKAPSKKAPAAKPQPTKASRSDKKAATIAKGDDEPEEKPKPKFNWAAAKAAKMAGPVAPGSKPIPQAAAPDCLAGLTFVFTGELSSLSRDEAIELAKRHGGRVTGQPSSKTSFVVLGSDAGPSKLAAIKKNNLTTLDEDSFLQLIATRVPDPNKLDNKTKKKQEKEEEAIRTAAKEMERREKQTAQGGGAKGTRLVRRSVATCGRLTRYFAVSFDNLTNTKQNSTNIANTSLDGWMTGGNTSNAVGVTITDKTCLIMDEVDGMSAGDRGGVGALAALIRKTKIPIICIANDRGAPKMKPLSNAAYNLTFRRPEATTIRSRILSIAFKEKMKIPANVIDQLVEGAQSDIRQVLNMLSTWKLSNDTMDFDEGKALAKANEKYGIMTPFNIIQKMLGPYMFSPTARETLNDKMELYFHDHSFVPLFIQENYLKTQPAKIRNIDGPEKILKQLQLMDKAASSISDGDLVDSLIHGPEQHWSLMPLHAVCSTVRPASFLYGMGAAYGGPNAMSFPQWLGQNSKQNKLVRQLTEIQARMRVKVSGDKTEIRQSYTPALFPHIVKPLMDEGASAVDEVIERMDDYFLTREDWDTIVELGLDHNKDDIVLKKISTATKTSFTKKYNSRDHPIPFYKAQDFGKAPKKLAAGPLPDLEEFLDVDDDK